MTDIEWACKWVGWFYEREERMEWVFEIPPPRTEGDTKSLDDLAEAVRVKCNSEDGQVIFDAETGDWDYCLQEWGNGGPPAFFKAVRGVIDDGQ